jgi:hypothetical protein
MINTATSAVILKQLGVPLVRGGALPLLSLPRTLWFLLLMQPSDSRFGVFLHIGVAETPLCNNGSRLGGSKGERQERRTATP